ncbi:ABC transporter permease [Terrabacter sp. 2RAF25]|uniref:ABC transporter permease n=1 Tax=Terrabacter sp. 2RAF25 TaxID=3232998 RepID=UPI003F9B6AB0
MSTFAGTGSLVRLASRRDRVLIPVSILALVAFAAGSARATIDLYPSLASALDIIRPLVANPASVALYGPMTSLSLDSFAVFKTVLLGGVFVCLLAYIVVRRHTRTEEESGRLELLGAGAIERRSPLTAAILLATTTVVATAVLAAASLAAVGLDGRGSVAFAVSWTIMGLSWVGITAVAAQLTETTRGTAAISLGALGAAFLLRALGDTAGADNPARLLSWLSPLGWGQRVSPYGENQLWPIWLGLVAYVLLVALAYRLQERRDLGAGLLPSRPGRPRGSMRSVGALTTRLARGTLIGWGLSAVVIGAVVGSIAANLESLSSSDTTLDLLRKLSGADGQVSLINVFFTTELHIIALAVAAMGISIVTRLRTEETSSRAEVLLTTTSRIGWAASHLVIALTSTAVVMALVGLVAGAADAQRSHDLGASIGRLVPAALVTVPAIWVTVAVALLLVGWVPRLTGLAWAALITFLLLSELVPVLGLPAWMTNLSPFGHVPSMPAEDGRVLPLVLLTVVAAIVAATGLVGLRRRDVIA